MVDLAIIQYLAHAYSDEVFAMLKDKGWKIEIHRGYYYGNNEEITSYKIVCSKYNNVHLIVEFKMDKVEFDISSGNPYDMGYANPEFTPQKIVEVALDEEAIYESTRYATWQGPEYRCGG